MSRRNDRRVPWPALALGGTLAVALFAAAQGFVPISLGDLTTAELGNLFLTLALVALVIERAVEVYVGNLFDPEEARLVTPQRQKRAELDGISEAIDHEAARARGASADARTQIATEPTLKKLRDDADRARRELSELRADVAEALVDLKSRKAAAAAAAATALGAAAAVVGLRVLGEIAPDETLDVLMPPKGTQRFWFDSVDVVLTALLLAGGADGIHSILGDFLNRRKDLADPVT